MSEPTDNTFATNLLNNLMETWILPDVRKRQSDGELPKPIELDKAQIIFKLDGNKPLVRVNSEVRGQASIKLKDGCDIKAGDPIFANQIESITSFQLPKDERDWGHATIMFAVEQSFIFFDFIYNKHKCAEHVSAANEFLQTATQSLASGLHRAFIDNLASASELAAKAYLLSQPDRSVMAAKSHTHIHSKINAQGKVGNVDGAHIEAFNQLQQLRYPARYLDKDFNFEDVDSEELLSAIGDFIAAVRSHVRVAL